MTILGLPGATYNLSAIAQAVQNGNVVEAETGVSSSTTGIPINDLSPSGTREVITFTDNLGNTLTLLGLPNAVYDLQLLPYLQAVTSALDMFMYMQFGADYETIKNQFLQQAGLV
jgi:hypothetical protein